MIEKLQQEYINHSGEIKSSEMITNVIPKGVTVLFGARGVGKTHSIVKHLNRNGIKPALIDFDNNEDVYNEFDCYLVGGKWYINRTRAKVSQTAMRFEDAKQRLDKIIMQYAKSKDRGYYEPIYKSLVKDNYKKFRLEVLYNLDEDLQELAGANIDIINEKINLLDIFAIKDSVVIIDTYAYAIPNFDDLEAFERLIENLIRLNNSVIIVSHETGERGAEPEVSPVFANHAQAKLRLKRDITKTKKEEVYLIVEKLRGYKGEPIIKDWER